MAIIKHIKSKNINYSSALEYLMFQHDEITNKPILDDFGRMIYRDEYYNPDTEEPGITEIIIGKHRAGPTGTVKLKWMGDIQKFGNLEMRSQQ